MTRIMQNGHDGQAEGAERERGKARTRKKSKTRGTWHGDNTCLTIRDPVDKSPRSSNDSITHWAFLVSIVLTVSMLFIKERI